MVVDKTSGFTEAELAAFEWSKSQRSLKDRKSHRYKRYSSSSDSDDEYWSRKTSDGRYDHHSSTRKNKDINSEERRSRFKSDRRRKRSPYRSRSRSYGSYRLERKHNDDKASKHRTSPLTSDSDIPDDPYNPLKYAHKKEKYYKSESLEDRIDRWDHDLYESDGEFKGMESEFKRRKNIDFVVDTRKGSWRSRAGGVYIPPDVDDNTRDLYYDYKKKTSEGTLRPDPVYELD